MKIYDVEPMNYYTCQSCDKVVETSNSYKITLSWKPCCSLKCFMQVMKKRLKMWGLTKNLYYFHQSYPATSTFYDINYPQLINNLIILDNINTFIKANLHVKEEVIIIK